MLIDAVEHYLSIRRVLGYRLADSERRLRLFTAFATSRGEDHVRGLTALDWAREASSPHERHVRYRDVRRFARFAHGEDPRHEIPRGDPFPSRWVRPLPYIYSAGEVSRMISAVATLEATYPLKRVVVATIIGLIAATGLRVGEALRLRLGDVHPAGYLAVRLTKFRKSRLVPLHSTTVEALDTYLRRRRRVAGLDDHLFVSIKGGQLPYPTLLMWFHQAQRAADIPERQGRLPRIHDLRHTFATRALERCADGTEAISRHRLALPTYLGHATVESSYWYIEATPELMTGMADTAEKLMWGGGR